MVRIVLGTSAGFGSDRAAQWTVELARRVGAEVSAVEAYARGSAEESPDVAEQERAGIAADLRRWGAVHGLSGARTDAVEASPVDALMVEVDRVNADVVVIGSTEVEGTTELGLGSVAHRLAHVVHRPLIAVPPGTSGFDGPVVVGVDGSEGSERALRWGAALGGRLGVAVIAVHCVDAIYDTFIADEYLDLEEREAAGQAHGLMPSVEFVERVGSDPATALREVGDERDAALLVVSARSRHSLGGYVVGRTVDQLLHRPGRPVAVVPRDFEGTKW